MEALRDTLDPWLGRPRWKQTEGRVTFVYRFESEGLPSVPLRLKVETNTREHFSVYGLVETPFRVSSRWFEGSCDIHSYVLDELLATKLRALYQRRQGRDLFDLSLALATDKVDPSRIVEAFLRYMAEGGHEVTRGVFKENLARKMLDREFLADISPLLSPGYTFDPHGEARLVSSRLLDLLPDSSASPRRQRASTR